MEMSWTRRRGCSKRSVAWDMSCKRDAVRPIVDRLFLTLVAESEVIDGVRDTLDHIADLGITVGIVSSAVHHDFLEWTLEHHGLRPSLRT